MTGSLSIAKLGESHELQYMEDNVLPTLPLSFARHHGRSAVYGESQVALGTTKPLKSGFSNKKR